MKYPKKLASLIIAAIMVLTMVPQAVFADTDETTEYGIASEQDQLLVDDKEVTEETEAAQPAEGDQEEATEGSEAVTEESDVETFAEEIVGTEENQILVVYEKNAECTKEIKAEGFDVTEKKVNADVQEVAEEQAEELVQDMTAKVSDVEVISDGIAGDGAVVEMTVTNYEDINDTMKAIEANPQVAHVQLDLKYELVDQIQVSADTQMDPMAVSVNDTYAGYEHYLNPWDSTFNNYCGANLKNAWSIAKTNGKVSVAVLDTGVEASHPDLKANIDLTHAADTSTTTVTTGVSTDPNGHGTHVAGMIAATANNDTGVVGTSYNAKVIPIKVFDANGACYSSSLCRAYTYLDNLIETKQVTNLHVINMSLGGYTRGYYDDLLETYIKEMKDEHNVVTVCAGGNGDASGNPITDPSYPSDFADCVSVTALEKNGTNAKWSDYNASKDISAPGTSCINTYTGSKYVYMSGTSVASPLVAGIMALLWVDHPSLTVDRAKEAIYKTAHPVNTSANNRGKSTGSAGAIDAYAALQYLGPAEVVPTTQTSTQPTATQPTTTAPTTTSPTTQNPTQPTTTQPANPTNPTNPSTPGFGSGNPGTGSGSDQPTTGVGNGNGGNGGSDEVTVPGTPGDNSNIGGGDGADNSDGDDNGQTNDQPIEFNGTVKLSTYNYTYNGSVKNPDVTVLDADGEVVDPSEYVLNYPSGRKNIGTYTAKVTFNDETYTGTRSVSFNINPKGASIKAPTAAKGAITAKWYKQTSKMPTYRIGGYQVQIAKDSKFTTGVKTYTVSGYTKYYKKIKGLSRKTTYYVHVRTYIKVGGKYYYSSWSSAKAKKTK
ncbi:MAG: S8 family serine peptidase [Eubacterium sp.]|nr:S8 family serine peptidase [Candidatus Colimonas fimequi]